MTKADQEKAALFAEAASVNDPASLSPGQWLLLQEKAERLFGSQPKPDMGSLLDYSRKWLLSPLKGELGKVDISPVWRMRDGEPELSIAITKPAQAFLADLWHLIHLRPFPFKRCPVCGRVFVSQNKKKRYCSGNCAYRGIEEARKERRRPQARERMRRLRKRRRVQHEGRAKQCHDTSTAPAASTGAARRGG
jgi:hypothetical protein